jgi:SAM-dependent methyltransferase
MTTPADTQQERRYHLDRNVWNRCASTYEQRIVRGHPDVTAYESFEHSMLEKLVLFLTRDCRSNLAVYDFGCGSGRIHQLLIPFLPPASGNGAWNAPGSGGVLHVGGVDFSEKMIAIALANLKESGGGNLYPDYLSYDVGSAFDVQPYVGEAVPLAVSVCNSIGVMQGPEGAAQLFRTMGNHVRERSGIALISCYRREAVAGYALGNYESTMDVCGKPAWLQPAAYADGSYTLVPQYYKRAYDESPDITVDVLDGEGNCVERDVVLTRDERAVQEVVTTGEIRTGTDYQSHWYSDGQVRQWMREHWGDATLWHIPGSRIDRLRGEPAQLAIGDFGGTFAPLARRWGLEPMPESGDGVRA